MLETKKIEESIKNCLSTLSNETNITIATLPNQANAKYEKIGSKKTVKIIVPVVTADRPEPTQKIRYEILLHIISQERIEDNITSIDSLKNKIINLITTNISDYICYVAFWFSSYRLVPAQNGFWSAELTFVMETENFN